MSEFYRLGIQDVAQQLDTHIEQGLSESEAQARLSKYGPNALPTGESRSLISVIIEQFKNIMVIVLIAAAVISYFVGEPSDTLIILLIVVLNAALGTFQEYRAEKAMEALSAMQVPKVNVRRGGAVKEISAEQLVPGDIVLLGEGNAIPADGRLVDARNLMVDEAILTGESTQAEKALDAIDKPNLNPGDQTNMVFMGTNVNSGRAIFIVTETGGSTRLGQIANMLISLDETKTPLQKQLDRLSLLLVQGALLVVAAVFIIGLVRGIALGEMLLTSLSLAVAAVPEGLPAIITVALSLGASRMVRRQALIRRLPAVETLGSVTTICTDKTGTLTKNEMTAVLVALPGTDDVRVTGVGYEPVGDFYMGEQQIDPKSDSQIGSFLRALALATDAYIDQDTKTGKFSVVGDTTEGALLVAALKGGEWSRGTLERDLPRVNEIPFSSERKAMTTFHEVRNPETAALVNARYLSITKGAPDRLIEWGTRERVDEGERPLTPERKQQWQQYVDWMAGQGLRVLGAAYRELDALPDKPTPEQDERDLTLLGLIGILDPARPEAREAVARAKSAGVRTIMITGDHALTAEAIARDLGIITKEQKAVTGAELSQMDDAALIETLKHTSAFARVAPEQKLRIVQVLRSQGEVAAMTGDGVNDAPALKQADIGVAMGITGTEVSKGAADMILMDDNFATIVSAVEEGRTVYDNIRKFVRYLVSSNLGEILVMFVALLVGMQIPLLAIQILWVNLVTDGLPAMTLGFEPAESGVMKRKPRPQGESIFAHGLARQVIMGAVITAIVTLAGFVYGHYAYGMDPFSPTLGAEHLSDATIRSFSPLAEEMLPRDWDEMTEAQRVDFMVEEKEAAGGGAHSAGDTLLDHLIEIPRTIAFSVLAFSQMFHVMGIHAGDSVSFFRVWFSKNKWLGLAVLSTFILQLLVIYVPLLQGLFHTVALPLGVLGICLLLASVLLIYTEIDKILIRRFGLASYAVVND